MNDVTTPALTCVCSGNEALARAAWEAGTEYVASYPGSPVTGAVEALGKYPDIRTKWAVNEKVALEMAVGAAHGGSRAMAVMKHVGLNVAADPLFNVAYTGVEGGLVLVVGDDPGAKCSQNAQDTRKLAYAAGIPLLEPANLQEILVMTRLAFEISEEYDLPVIVKTTTQLCYSRQKIVTSYRKYCTRTKGFAKPVAKYLLLPVNALPRRRAQVRQLARLRASTWNRWLSNIQWPQWQQQSYDIGIITAGYPSQIVHENYLGQLPILKIGMSYPAHEAVLREFSQKCRRLIVAEEGSTFLQDQINQLGIQTIRRKESHAIGEFKIEQLALEQKPAWQPCAVVANDETFNGKAVTFVAKTPGVDRHANRAPSSPSAFPKHVVSFADLAPAEPLPPRPPGFCAGCSHVGIFHLLGRLKVYVVGDIGCYTLGATEPFNALHANLCMGASIGTLQGYVASLGDQAAENALAIIGDSTFFHSGIPGLLSALSSPCPGTLLISDNSGTAMTGYQMTNRVLSREQWAKLLTGLGVEDFKILEALDMKQLESQVGAALKRKSFSVLVLKGNCVQSKTNRTPTNYRYTIREDFCNACGTCMSTDCPSIKATADSGSWSYEIGNECIGCGLCSQICPQKAIVPRTLNFGPRFLVARLRHLNWYAIIARLRQYAILKYLFDRFEKRTF